MLNAHEPFQLGTSPNLHHAQQSSSGNKSGPTGVTAMIGLSCLLAVAANLGVPLLHSPVALAVLLVLAGYSLARAVHRSTSSKTWRIPFVVGLVARAVPAVLLVITLTGLYGLITSGGMATSQSLALLSATTFTSNIVPFFADVFYLPVEHLWTIALLGQVAVTAPFFLTAGAQRMDRRRRAWVLVAVAAGLSAIRIGVTGVSSSTAWTAPLSHDTTGFVMMLTMLDGLLLGMALGTMPLATFHRRPATKAVAPALLGLLALLTVPAFGGQVITVGLRIPLAEFFTATVLAAAAIFGLPKWVNGVLSSNWLNRIGARSFGLFLWHIPFSYAVSGANPFRWHGPIVFVIVLTLSLAAASTTYRSIELPAQATLQWLMRRWFPTNVIDLTTPAPQRDKWRRWDEISLDNLPIPVRRRSNSVSAGRLWQHGDRNNNSAPNE